MEEFYGIELHSLNRDILVEGLHGRIARERDLCRLRIRPLPRPVGLLLPGEVLAECVRFDLRFEFLCFTFPPFSLSCCLFRFALFPSLNSMSLGQLELVATHLLLVQRPVLHLNSERPNNFLGRRDVVHQPVLAQVRDLLRMSTREDWKLPCTHREHHLCPPLLLRLAIDVLLQFRHLVVAQPKRGLLEGKRRACEDWVCLWQPRNVNTSQRRYRGTNLTLRLTITLSG